MEKQITELQELSEKLLQDVGDNDSLRVPVYMLRRLVDATVKNSREMQELLDENESNRIIIAKYQKWVESLVTEKAELVVAFAENLVEISKRIGIGGKTEPVPNLKEADMSNILTGDRKS